MNALPLPCSHEHKWHNILVNQAFLRLPGEHNNRSPHQEIDMKMDELFSRYERECIPDLQPRSQRDYRGILIYLRKDFGHMEANEVKPRHIVNFLDVKTGRVHRNRMVTILSTVFKKAIGKWCVEDDLRNPCDGVERWPTKPRTRYVSDNEFERFRAICCAQVQIAMDLALLTGQRQGDIIGLTWKMVHAIGLPRDKWFVEVRQGKTGKHLGIAISPALETVLKRAKIMEPQWPREYVIRTNPKRGDPKKKGQRYTDDGFRAMWQRYCREWERLGNKRFHFHDLRAKAISDNKNLDAAYLLAGHIDIKMTRRVYDRNIRMVEPLR
jgi:integrase